MSRTLILVKPDAFERALTGEVIARFERKGLRIVALKSLHADEAIANQHYAEHTEKPFFGELVSFITGGPLVAIVLRGRRGGSRRPPADRRHQPGRGRPRLDPRRLRPRGDLQHGPRLRLRRVGRARDRDLVPRAVLSVVLASGSPQRREILAKLGVEFEVVVPGVEELTGGDPEVRGVRERAAEGSGRASAPEALVIACDTDVVLDGKALGKPADAVEAREYLDRMSGRAHEVLSGLVVLDGRRGAQRAGTDLGRLQGAQRGREGALRRASASGGAAPAATRSRRSARPWSSGSRGASPTWSACRWGCWSSWRRASSSPPERRSQAD